MTYLARLSFETQWQNILQILNAFHFWFSLYAFYSFVNSCKTTMFTSFKFSLRNMISRTLNKYSIWIGQKRISMIINDLRCYLIYLWYYDIRYWNVYIWDVVVLYIGVNTHVCQICPVSLNRTKYECWRKTINEMMQTNRYSVKAIFR